MGAAGWGRGGLLLLQQCARTRRGCSTLIPLCRPYCTLHAPQLEAAERELAGLRTAASAAATASRRARRRAEGDAEAAVGEYDSEVGAAAGALAGARGAHEELLARIEVGGAGGGRPLRGGRAALPHGARAHWRAKRRAGLEVGEPRLSSVRFGPPLRRPTPPLSSQQEVVAETNALRRDRAASEAAAAAAAAEARRAEIAGLRRHAAAAAIQNAWKVAGRAGRSGWGSGQGCLCGKRGGTRDDGRHFVDRRMPPHRTLARQVHRKAKAMAATGGGKGAGGKGAGGKGAGGKGAGGKGAGGKGATGKDAAGAKSQTASAKKTK
jgi:hypothetical protein